MSVSFDVVEELLEELQVQVDDPEAAYELEQMERHYHNALQAEYLEKDGGEYDL
ncbi:MAG: hypothetical protein ABEK04_03390 [Candidatus Nanohalobium sp.]